MHILLVDCNRAALLKSADALRRQYPAAKLVFTSDAMDAVQYSLNNPVDAVYTEVRMPRCSGFDVLRLVRKFHPDADTCILSDTEEFAAQVGRQRLGRYLLKRALWTCEGPGSPEACGRRAAGEEEIVGGTEISGDELDQVAGGVASVPDVNSRNESLYR